MKKMEPVNGKKNSSTSAKKPFRAEMVELSKLKPHPRNYRSHPDDQIAHLVKSLEDFGFYRNVVVAKDGTILAGHGVVQASQRMGLKEIPVIRIDAGPNDARALKVLTGDNEMARLAEINDRLLTDLLKEIKGADVDGLAGTGFDDKMLAALAMVTRTKDEIKDFDAAMEWAGAGMPEHLNGGTARRVVVNFLSEDHMLQFIRKNWGKPKANTFSAGANTTVSLWWPEEVQGEDDLKSVQFVEGEKR